MTTTPPSAVYDCMVFLQGAARPGGPAASCIRLAEKGQVELFLSSEILAEIRDVLTRPKLQRKFPILTTDYVDELLQAVLHYATMVNEIPVAFMYARDPKDEPYINLALAAEADHLVSRDTDLLDLMKPSDREGMGFRKQFPNLLILDPVDFLRKLGELETNYF